MGPLLIVHVEDEDLKAGYVGKALTLVAIAVGVEIEVCRLRAIEELYLMSSVAAAEVEAVVSDWRLPMLLGPTAELHDHGGAAVVTWAVNRDLPVVVISGGLRPDDWADTETKRWATAGTGYVEPLRWLLAVAMKRRAAASAFADAPLPGAPGPEVVA